MENESIFTKDGKFYILKKDRYEPIEKFNERGWFITKCHPSNDKEYESAITLSRIWINIKYNGCEYNKAIMDKINLITST